MDEFHLFERTGSEDALVSLGLQLLTEQYIAPNGSWKNPRLLGGIRQLTFDLYHTLFSWKLPQNSAEERRLQERGED